MPPPLRVILASTSIYRRELLQRLMIPFESIDPAVNEEAYHSPEIAPADLALQLAVAKARSVAARIGADSRTIVIGGDQLAACEGQILGKPGNRARAIEQLTALSGRTHQLLTAIAVIRGEQLVTHLDTIDLWMHPLTRAEIERYVDLDTPFDCAGSYKFEAHGVALFADVRCDDATTITGLPLVALNRILRELVGKGSEE